MQPSTFFVVPCLESPRFLRNCAKKMKAKFSVPEHLGEAEWPHKVTCRGHVGALIKTVPGVCWHLERNPFAFSWWRRGWSLRTTHSESWQELPVSRPHTARLPHYGQQARGLRDLSPVIWGHLGFTAWEPLEAVQIRTGQISGSLNNICVVWGFGCGSSWESRAAIRPACIGSWLQQVAQQSRNQSSEGHEGKAAIISALQQS